MKFLSAEYDGQGGETNLNFHHDHLRSVTGLSGHDGEAIEQTTYSPFGAVYHQTGTPTTELLYTGRENDTETGLYYYRARYYDPVVGRFTSEDPLGFEAGVNFYAYVEDSPLSNNDPTGYDGINAGLTLKVAGSGLTNTLSIRYPGITDEPFDIQLQTGISPGFIGQVLLKVLAPKNPLSDSHGFEIIKGTVNVGWDFGSNVGSGVDLNVDYHAGAGYLGITGTTQNLLEPDAPPVPSSFELNIGPQLGISASPEIQATLSARDVVNIGADLVQNTSGFLMPASAGAAGGFVLYPDRQNRNFLSRIYSK